MTPLEAEAMLVRHAAGVRGLDRVDEDGRLEILGLIVFPPEKVLAASMEVARERGPSSLAHRMATGSRQTRRRKPGRAPVSV